MSREFDMRTDLRHHKKTKAPAAITPRSFLNPASRLRAQDLRPSLNLPRKPCNRRSCATGEPLGVVRGSAATRVTPVEPRGWERYQSPRRKVVDVDPKVWCKAAQVLVQNPAQVPLENLRFAREGEIHSPKHLPPLTLIYVSRSARAARKWSANLWITLRSAQKLRDNSRSTPIANKE